jgi:hypothetical protein
MAVQVPQLKHARAVSSPNGSSSSANFGLNKAMLILLLGRIDNAPNKSADALPKGSRKN